MSDLRFRGDNGGRGRNPFSWREFDRLPKPVRTAINYALCDLGSHRAAMNLRIGKSVAQVCAIERGVAAGVMRAEILKAYGPGHPFLSKSA